ncbi:MAG: NAD-dependent epimerase/dehydratase family protein [Nitrososphaera sp.]
MFEEAVIGMKILVTGGAGFIGSNIANTLRREGNEIVVLDDLSLGTTSNLEKGIEFVRGSVMDYEAVKKASSGCDYIFHDAAKSSSPMFAEDPREGIDVNIMGFMNVMEAARRSGKVRKVIYASSSSIYNGLPMPFNEGQVISPKTFYETSFYCREIAARSYYLEYGVPCIGLRYFSVYGPNERHKGKFANNISQFLWDMAEGISPVIYGDGSQSRDFTYVQDVVSANLLAMRSGKEFGIYNVGTGVETTFNQVIELINDNLGTDITPKYVNNPIKNYVQDTLADIALIKSELGYSPARSVREGVKSLVAVLDKVSKTKLSQATTSA